MAIQLYREQLQTTPIPNSFIDRLMPDANGEFVKVYLYLLRCAGMPEGGCTVSGIADALSNTEADVMRALRYWERVCALTLDVDGGEIRGIHFSELRSESTDGTAPLGVDETGGDISFSQPMPKTQDLHIAGTQADGKALNPEAAEPEILDDEAISELFAVIQAYLGARQLTRIDMERILGWLDTLKLSRDLVLYLVESCVGKGHTSLNYMDKVALSWCENHITTVEQAKASTDTHSRLYYGVQKAFGISGRNLGEKECRFLDRWSKELGFETTVILEACNRTMSAIQKPSFEYTDSILTGWHHKNVHSTADIAALDKSFQTSGKTRRDTISPKNVRKTRFSNFDQRSYDYDKLEKMLLNTTV